MQKLKEFLITNKKNILVIFGLLIIFIPKIVNFFYITSDISYTEFITYVEEGKVESIVLDSKGKKAEVKLEDEEKLRKVLVPSVDSVTEILTYNKLKEKSISFEIIEKKFDIFSYILISCFIIALLIIICGIYYIVKCVKDKINNKDVLSDETKKKVACHEAGHAIACLMLGEGYEISEISIIPDGEALGNVIIDNFDDNLLSKSNCLIKICILLAGRAAENIILGEPFSGAEEDLEEATYLATLMVTKYGMSEKLGLMVLSEEETVLVNKEFNHPVSIEIRNILNECYERVEGELNKNIHLVKKVSHTLLQKEKISGEELKKIID